MGIVVVGWMWARMARLRMSQLAGEHRRAAFFNRQTHLRRATGWNA